MFFTINIINLDAKRNKFAIEGSLSLDKKNHKFKLSPRFNDEAIDYFEHVIPENTYKFQIPADENGILEVFLLSETDDNTKTALDLKFTRLSRLGNTGRFDYRIIRSKLMIPQQKSLTLTDFSLRKIIKQEAGFFIQSLREAGKIRHNTIKTLVIETLRISAILRMRFNRPKIWLFSDRAVSGGDNSETLFRYVAKQNNKNIKPYFAVNSGTATYKNLKKQGYNVVKFRSIKHLYITMVADLLLPSHMDIAYLYPWVGVWRKYNGLLQYAVVHTQHGLVLNDISGYAGKHKKNAQLFLSVCEWEKKHLTESQYGYTSEEVPVTGAPRYDGLDGAATRRVISIHPTWRSWLAPEEHAGNREYSKVFSNSEYHDFYQKMLNDKRVIKALQENDYILKFYLHPNHRANLSDFSVTDSRVQLMNFPYNYKEMFSESAGFITDYSNTLFDFAYLKKPIVHTQFDSKAFFSKQQAISRQLFNYEKEGFGPVCKDYESSVQEIIKLIEDGPKMPKKYKERADQFFTYSDKNNCKRAYEAILKFQNET